MKEVYVKFQWYISTPVSLHNYYVAGDVDVQSHTSLTTDLKDEQNTSSRWTLDDVIIDTGQLQQNTSYNGSSSDDVINNVTSINSAFYMNTSLPVSVTDILVTITTNPLITYSRKPIYHRGHLIYHPSPEKRIFNPIKESRDELAATDSIDYFRDELVDANSRIKRKHTSSRSSVHDYNFLYDKHAYTVSLQLICYINTYYWCGQSEVVYTYLSA